MAVISQLKLNSISGLPNEYKQVEYIESTGTQWIDSGYIANNNTRVVIDYQFTSLIDSFLLGCRNNSTSNAYTVNLAYSGKNSVTSYGNTGDTQFGDADVNRHIIDKNKNKFYFDGELLLIQTENSFTCPSSLEIFSCHNGDTSGYLPSLARIYSLKIYDDDMIVINYIPCVRKVDNTAGLYDLVNNKFYTNDGTGEFTVGNEVGKVVTRYNKSTISKITVDDVDYHFAKSNQVENGVCENAVNEPIIDMNIKGNSIQRLLPEEYQEVEYLENSGIQRIDTGLVPTSSTSIDITYQSMYVVGQSQYILGSRTNASATIEYALNGSSANNYWDVRFNGSTATILDVNRTTDKYRSTIELNNGSGSWTLTNLTTNSTNEMTLSGAVVNATANLYLFAFNQIYSNTHPSLRIFGCEIYESGVLVRNYVPCYRKNDSVAGLYDLATNEFYTNVGTGSFTVGADIESVPSPEQPLEVESVGEKTKNLFNKETATLGKNLNAYTGELYNSNARCVSDYIEVDSSKQYTLVYNPALTASRYLVCYDENKNYLGQANGAYKVVSGNSATTMTIEFLISEVKYIRANCHWNEDGTASEIDTFMIYEGSGDNTYEPYGYRIPVTAKGENMVDMSKTPNETSSSFTYADGVYTVANSQAYRPNRWKVTLKPNTKYIVSVESINSTKGFVQISGYFSGTSIVENSVNLRDYALTKTFTTTNDGVVTLSIYTSELVENLVVKDVQIIELYSTTNIYLNEPLRKVGIYADYIDYKNKKVVRNIGVYNFTGTAEYYYNAGSGFPYACKIGNNITNYVKGNNIPLLSNCYKNVINTEIDKTTATGTFCQYQSIWYFNHDNQTIGATQFASLLKTKYQEGNPVKVYYQLETPIEETIDIPLIKTFDRTTNISVNTKLEPSSTSLSYWKQI